MKALVVVYIDEIGTELGPKELAVYLYSEATKWQDLIPGQGAVSVRIGMGEDSSLETMAISAVEGLKASVERRKQGDMAPKFSIEERDEKGRKK